MVTTNPIDKVQEFLSFYEKRGIEIGQAIGMIRGKRTMLLRLLCLKFREVTPAIAIEVECMDEAQLNTLTAKILGANSLEDMGFK